MSFYENCHLIIKGQSFERGNLWLGDYDSARSKNKLKERKIFHIITAGLGMKISYSNQFKHKLYPLYDCQTQKINRFFDDSYNFIQEALKNGNILIHCFAGVSRSASIVIAYLMKKNNWTFKQAFQHVKKCRPYIGPNKGFLRQLRQHEKNINSKESTKQLKDMTYFTPNKKQKEVEVDFVSSVINYSSKYKGARGLSFDPLKNYQKIRNNSKGVSIAKTKNMQVSLS